MSSYIGNRKYIVDEPVNEVLGKPERKAGNFNSTKVIAEETVPEMNMMMDYPVVQVPQVDPLMGYGGLKQPAEKMLVKEAGKGRSK